MSVTVRFERSLETDGLTLVYRLVEDDESVWWSRAKAVADEGLGEPLTVTLKQVAGELDHDAAGWAYHVTRKLQHDLGKRLADTHDAMTGGHREADFDELTAEADRLAAKIAMVTRELSA